MKTINAGQLDRQVTITAPGEEAPDGYGGFTEGTGASSLVWCAVRPLRLDEVLRYGLNAIYGSCEFTFRYETAKNVNNRYILTFEGRTFDSPHITNVDEKRTMITIIANERTN